MTHQWIDSPLERNHRYACNFLQGLGQLKGSLGNSPNFLKQFLWFPKGIFVILKGFITLEHLNEFLISKSKPNTPK